LDGYCPLLDLVGETEEATELSQIGYVSAVAAAPIFGDPFSSDKDPDDHLGVRVEASSRASIVDWYSIDGEKHRPAQKPAAKKAVEE